MSTTIPEYTAVEAEELVLSMLEVERQLESSTYVTTRRHWSSSRITTTCSWIELSPSPLARPLIPPANEPMSTDVINPSSETPSDSLVIPDGQPLRPLTENHSFVDTPSPLILPGGEMTDSTASTTAGSLKTLRRSRHKSLSPTELASCVRNRTTPALPGVRKKHSRAKHQPPPDSQYAPLVTDSGYLITNVPKGTPLSSPKGTIPGWGELSRHLLLLIPILRFVIVVLVSRQDHTVRVSAAAARWWSRRGQDNTYNCGLGSARLVSLFSFLS